MQIPHVMELVAALTHAGLVLTLMPDDALKATPAKVLNDELRAAIRSNKAALVEYLKQVAAGEPETPSMDSDCWCWPHSEAMNGQEIDTFNTRLSHFTAKGLPHEDAEREADRLVTRDRGCDDRRLCMECAHLHGTGQWRCGNWSQTNRATTQQDATLPKTMVVTLLRCGGFGGLSS